MTRLRTVLALALLPSLLAAEETKPATPTAPAANPNIEVSTGGAGSKPKPRRRTVSTDVSKSVTSGFKYDPPPPPTPEEDLVDMREIDKPRNQIIRLPKHVVQTKKPPVFNDRNLYSKEMLRRLAYQKYISSFNRNVLNKYRLPLIGGGVDAYAMMMYEAEERERAMAETEDRIVMLRASGDDAEASRTKNDAQDTFMRRSGFGTNTDRRGTGR